eukprot:symbB.v1.2.003055.t1/scaffold161.1/size290820/6
MKGNQNAKPRGKIVDIPAQALVKNPEAKLGAAVTSTPLRFGDRSPPIQVVAANREEGGLPREYWGSNSSLAWTDLRGERLRKQADVKEAGMRMDASERKLQDLSSEVFGANRMTQKSTMSAAQEITATPMLAGETRGSPPAPVQLNGSMLWRLLLALLVNLKAAEDDGKIASSIWFVSWQHAGHIKALCPIARELQRRGQEVRVLVHEEVQHLVPKDLVRLNAGPLPWSWEEELEFRQVLWDPSVPEEGEEGARKADLSERYFTGSQQSLLQGLNETLHRLPREKWPGLLAIDVSSVGAMDLAEKLSLRFAVISSWPVGPTLQSVGEQDSAPWMPSELFAFTQTAQQQSFPDRLKRYVFTRALPWFMSWAGFHEPRRRLREELGLKPLELLEAPSTAANGGRPLLCILSHWGLDRARPVPPRAVLVGPVDDYSTLQTPDLPKSVEDWLQNRKTVYISFGTNVKPKKQVFRAILSAAETLKEEVQFLWDAEEQQVQALLNADSAHMMDLPQNVLFARVPQLSVLPRVNAFITHCGLNSVHEALHFGVPMLGLPFLGDQLVTARLLVEIGAGLRLSVPNLQAEQLEEALKMLLNTSSFAQAALHAGGLGRRAGGAVSAANSMEMALGGVHHLQMIVERQPEAARVWDVQLLLLFTFILSLGLSISCCWVSASSSTNSLVTTPSGLGEGERGEKQKSRKKRA